MPSSYPPSLGMCGFVREVGHFFVFYVVILFTFSATESFFRLMGTIKMDLGS